MNDYEIENKYGYKDDISYLDEVIAHTLKKLKVKKALFSVTLISDEEMQELNRTYRGIDKTTDVLSFAFEDNLTIEMPYRHLGDIFISIPRMQMQAKEYKHSEKRELSFLVCHGLLHLLGFDHTKSVEEEKRQFTLQDEILNELNIIV